jgi:hypothetical protein
MLSRIWSSSASASTRTLQPVRFFSVSCYKTQANSTQDQSAPVKSFLQKLKEYPELYQLQLARQGFTKELYAKIRNEPELLRAKQEQERHYKETKWATNPEYRARRKALNLAYYHAHKKDEAIIRNSSISRWCFRLQDKSKTAWARQNLPWKTHLPVIHAEKAYLFYSCCGIRRYLKSGWQSKTDPSELLCQKHYADRGWDAAMPEGYEDARTFTEILARYKQLNP